MKFAIATVFTLALAMGVQSSIVPFGVHTEVAGGGLSYTAVSSPVAVAAPWHVAAAPHWATPWAAHVAAPWAAHAPWGVHAHAPVVAAHAPVVVAAPEGQYVAKTRGALHTAPLAGHVNSVANVNVAPAPGTI